MRDPAMSASSDRDFYAAVPAFERFAEVARTDRFRPLPDSWWIGVTDVVGSTAATAAGRYKDVNVAGAAAISAVMNAVDGASFPFVFGGDGATFAVWPDARAAVEGTLARTVRWAAEDLALELRAALVPMTAVRAAGLDVTVARYRVAPGASYAMLAGGGAAWATSAMKAGRFAVPPAPPGERPDLEGLSCRWTPIAARHGAILSLIVAPRADIDPARVAPVLDRVLAEVASLAQEGHPVPRDGPGFAWPPAGLDLEARASRRHDEPLWLRRSKVALATLVAWVLDRTGWRLGGFDPMNYRRTTARNADYRKYDDCLRLTIDCDQATRRRIEAILGDAAAAGLVDFGVHAQEEALMTCIVPSILRDDHFHFIDGADGGYTRAAEAIKASARDASRTSPRGGPG